MKKIICVLFDLLTLAFLAGGYVFQYYVKRKMGMLRWLNFQNMKLQEKMPLDTWKYMAAAAVLLLSGLVIAGYVKKRACLEKTDWMMLGTMMLLIVVYVGYTVIQNVESMKSYYYLMPLFGMAALMQVLRNGAALILARKR